VVTAGNLTARLAPESGDLRTVHFDKDVEFREGGRVGRGRTARFEGEGALLVLEGDPQVVDEVAGTELKAQVIEIAQATGDLAARGKVRQARKAKGRAGGDGGFLSGEGAPTVVVAQKLKYEARPRRAQYEGEALLRNGKDEVRADTLVLEEPGPGQSRLTATGRVVSRLQPRPGKEGGKTQAAVEGRADEMRYEEKTGEIRYTGTVTLQQGDIKTKSPRATLYLAADGRGLERLEAGEPAEVEQGARRASGARATYTPGTETVVLVGDKVRLQDPGQAVEGRTITFYVGDDRIVVDGQEQARTEAIIRREPRLP
jgi:lipopolysaccharide transport protein LptA